jgi:hypothetical protein
MLDNVGRSVVGSITAPGTPRSARSALLRASEIPLHHDKKDGTI